MQNELSKYIWSFSKYDKNVGKVHVLGQFSNLLILFFLNCQISTIQKWIQVWW